MSGASHEQQHNRHLSGEFQFQDELASLFAQRQPGSSSPMQMQQQPWFFADYLQTPALEDYGADAFGARDFDLPVVEDEEAVKREMQLVDGGVAGMPGGGPGGTPHGVSVSSTSSDTAQPLALGGRPWHDRKSVV